MSTQNPMGVNWVEAVQPLETRRRAREVASFAEYLAEEVHGDPDRALEASASLAEWSDGDPELLAEARADVLGDTRRAQRVAHRVQETVTENNRYAVQLLDLASRAR
jgi:hypothetical protein